MTWSTPIAGTVRHGPRRGEKPRPDEIAQQTPQNIQTDRSRNVDIPYYSTTSTPLNTLMIRIVTKESIHRFRCRHRVRRVRHVQSPLCVGYLPAEPLSTRPLPSPAPNLRPRNELMIKRQSTITLLAFFLTNMSLIHLEERTVSLLTRDNTTWTQT